eukprot:g5045.t1
MTEWSWQQQVKSEKIKVRYSHSSATYKCKPTNSNNNKRCLIIFGGYNYIKGKPTWLQDLWLINLRTMEIKEIKSEASPQARYSASLISTKDSRAILFGGNDGGLRYQKSKRLKSKGIGGSYMFGSYMNDLWVLEEFKWAKRIVSNGKKPPPRSGHTASYMSNDNSMLIFGGLVAPFGINNKTFVSNDLWNYDISKNKWRLEVIGSAVDDSQINDMLNKPQSRYGHSSTTLDHNMYIFGGTFKENSLKCKLRFSCSKSLNDLWKYNYQKKEWTRLQPSSFISPGRLSHPTLTVHNINMNEGYGLILYGGANCRPACKCSGDLWRYDVIKNSWDKLAVTKKMHKEIPIHRYRHTMDYIPALNTYVLFGGESYGPSLYFNDIWTLTEIDSKTGSKVVDGNNLHIYIDTSLHYFQVIAFLFGMVVILSALRQGSYLRLRLCNRKRRTQRRFYD